MRGLDLQKVRAVGFTVLKPTFYPKTKIGTIHYVDPDNPMWKLLYRKKTSKTALHRELIDRLSGRMIICQSYL